jgi:putative membrane protein
VIRGRPHLGGTFIAVVVYVIVTVTILQLMGNDDGGRRMQTLNADANVFDLILSLPSSPIKIMSAGLLFLVAFRTQTSFQKWSQARKLWMDMGVACRELSMQSVAYMKDYNSASRFCRYLIVYVISVRFWLRCEDLDPKVISPLLTDAGLDYIMRNIALDEQQDDQKIDSDQSLSYQFKNVCGPLVVLEVLREILDDIVTVKKIGPFHIAMEASLKSLGGALANGERILNTVIPFAYISHLRSTLLLFLMMMPFFLVSELGWFTIICVSFFCLCGDRLGESRSGDRESVRLRRQRRADGSLLRRNRTGHPGRSEEASEEGQRRQQCDQQPNHRRQRRRGR